IIVLHLIAYLYAEDSYLLLLFFLLLRLSPSSALFPYTTLFRSIFVCLSMVQLMAVFISMRCTLCRHFLQVALTLILVVGYAIARSEERFSRNAETDLVCRLLPEKKKTSISESAILSPYSHGKSS